MTRDDLIEYLITHSPRPAISRAINEGRPIELLGGFKHIPPSNMPGWVIMITTRFKKRFYVALRVHKIWKHQLFVEMISTIPWRYWDGDKSNNLLYRGDRPQLYERLKRWQLKQKT
jgi:hypothetical protein